MVLTMFPLKTCRTLKMYPLADVKSPKPTNFYDISGKYINTLHSQDITFFEEVNQVVQEENNEAWDIEALGLLASIGIEKGKPFAPDARMKKILTEAAVVGSATQRAILFRNRDKSLEMWKGSKSWEVGFAGGSYDFSKDGVRLTKRPCSIPLLCNWYYSRNGYTAGWCWVTICNWLT